MTAPTDLFELVEGIALARPDAASDQPPPQGLPEGELSRILKWRASNKAAFNAKAENGDVELSILGVIGASWFSDGISARAVKYFLDQNKDAKNIRVLMDSPGGDYFDGVAIMNLLRRHSAKVTVEVIGEASSAGSAVCMGADDIEMAPGSVMMIHRAATCECGHGDDLRTTASMLDKIDGALGDIYAARTGKSRTEVDKLVTATTYMSAKEAVDLGFADREVPAKQRIKPAAQGGPRAQNIAPPAPPNTPPAPEARQTNPGPGEEHNDMALPKNICAALNIAEDADDNTALTAISKLKTSARTGASIEELLNVSGAAALGAVKALKDGQEQTEQLGTEVSKLKLVNVKRDFDSLCNQGTKDKKLSPANHKRYSENFTKAMKLADGENGEPGDAETAVNKAEELCEDLRGFLAVAHRIGGSGDIKPPAAGNGGSGPSQGSDGVMTHNGKTFEAKTPRERKALKDENPDLYDTMREDAQARGAI